MNTRKWGVFICGPENDVNEAHIEKFLVTEFDEYSDAEVFVEEAYLDPRDYYIIQRIWKNRE